MSRGRSLLFLLTWCCAVLSFTANAWAEGSCSPGPDRLCLNQDRFQVEVTWDDSAGASGSGRALATRSGVSGLLALSQGNDRTMLVKVLNGCSVNGRVWVFAAAPGDVGHTLTVTDTRTGATRSYSRAIGDPPQALTDTRAFDTCTPRDRSLPLAPGQRAHRVGEEPSFEAAVVAKQQSGPCIPGPEALCLHEGRFRVEMDWELPEETTGPGRAVPARASDTGLFWFFQRDNWEAVVQVADRCASEGHFAVISAAATNVGFDLRVTDTRTGITRRYDSLLGHPAEGFVDAEAFATCEATPPGEGTVRFVSDRSILLGGPGSATLVQVEVVDPDGRILENPAVTWSSSDPSRVAVEPLGGGRAQLRALDDGLGQVGISARSGNSVETATALLTVPGPETVLLSSTVVRGPRSLDRVVLAPTATTVGLRPGQIVVSGDQAGLLGRVTAVSFGADSVVVELAPASFAEAFERFSFSTRGEGAQRRVRLGAEDGDLVVRGADDRVLARSLLDRVECEAGGEAVDVDLQGAQVTATVDVSPQIDLVIESFEVQRFRVALTGSLDLVGTTGSVAIDGSAQGEATCTLDLPQLELPGIPVGVFTFSLTATPTAGVAVSSSFDGPKLSLVGPRASARGEITGGIEYTPAGWSGIGTESWSGDAQLDGTVDFDTEQAFSASAGPFVGLDAGLDAALGRGFLEIELADFRFAELLASADLELGFESPFDPADPAYVGPRWDLGLHTRGNLKAEVGESALKDALDHLGIPAAFAGKLELFSVETPIAGSPRPESIDVASPLPPEAEEPLDFVVQGSLADGTAQLWGGPVGDPLSELDTADYTERVASGRADLSWLPAPDAAGTHRFYPRLAVDAVSRIAPYGGGPDIYAEVVFSEEPGDGVPVIESIEPNPVVLAPGGEEELTLRFRDSDGDVSRLTFVVVEKVGSGFCSGSTRNPGVEGQTEGSILVTSSCTGLPTDLTCVFDTTLEDREGNVSEPYRWTLHCGDPSP